ncbi:class I SAM-dependent methyltransferase [Clostridium sp. MSJ-4]|uniref:Class I SAM-dependent methyltransferase n=1 Tax=Clostridium simiarum TaxID=2841506 RepID=A0ABS6EZ78_9CLOT|nr:class I SAM-dependent methyltransferase [Clostridium simiarum]
MESIINYYEAYDEENRLTKDRAHKIEFITTTHFLDKYINKNSKILDLGAGTGIYSFFYAEKGVDIVSMDICPKHVSIMKDKAKKRNISLNVLEGNALDLNAFSEETFDMVLCLGPLYHLMNKEERDKCIKECKRVLKSDGILATAYISRFATFINMIHRNTKNINDHGLRNISKTGKEFDDSRDCFYHSTYKEMEEIMDENKIYKLEHIGTDGIGGGLRHIINKFDDDEFDYWMKYHMETCKDESLIGYSQHGLYIGKKL